VCSSDLGSLADPSATTAVYMPRANLAAFISAVISAGLPAETPSAAVANATRPNEEIVRAPLADLATAMEGSAEKGPLLLLFGPSVATSSLSLEMGIKLAVRLSA